VSTQDKVKINKLPTGVPGLDEIVGGGLPEFSFNIIAGAPGSGKTTLAHQLVFANATPERPALYFTVLGESAIKMLRYQQQYQAFTGANRNDLQRRQANLNSEGQHLIVGYKFGYRHQFGSITDNYAKLLMGSHLWISEITLNFAYLS
jgi:predicted ATP-dependent serine protease